MLKALYLYKTHDADLIGLFETVGKKEFCIILKDSLRVLTRPGYTPKNPLPNFRPCYSGKDRYDIYVSIQSKKDEDIIELLSHVRNRQINAFIKQSLRFYLGVVTTLSSMLDIELIKTVPVYTPNGVIVFSNNMNMSNSNKNDKRPTKRKQDTISKANHVIRKKLETLSKEEEKSINIEQNNYKDMIIKENHIPIVNEESITEYKNLSNETDDDDLDVLSLLEGLMD